MHNQTSENLSACCLITSTAVTVASSDFFYRFSKSAESCFI